MKIVADAEEQTIVGERPPTENKYLKSRLHPGSGKERTLNLDVLK